MDTRIERFVPQQESKIYEVLPVYPIVYWVDYNGRDMNLVVCRLLNDPLISYGEAGFVGPAPVDTKRSQSKADDIEQWATFGLADSDFATYEEALEAAQDKVDFLESKWKTAQTTENIDTLEDSIKDLFNWTQQENFPLQIQYRNPDAVEMLEQMQAEMKYLKRRTDKERPYENFEPLFDQINLDINNLKSWLNANIPSDYEHTSEDSKELLDSLKNSFDALIYTLQQSDVKTETESFQLYEMYDSKLEDFVDIHIYYEKNIMTKDHKVGGFFKTPAGEDEPKTPWITFGTADSDFATEKEATKFVESEIAKSELKTYSASKKPRLRVYAVLT